MDRGLFHAVKGTLVIAPCRFYSITGRISILRFVLVAAATAFVMFAVSHVDWLWGLPANIVAGGIGGAAFAKLLVETIRRLRDAGISRRITAWVALAAGVATVVALYGIMVGDAPWAHFVLDAMGYVVPIACAVALLWPSRRDTSENVGGNDRAGMAIVVSCVVGGAFIMGFIAWFSIGMDANNRRNAAIQDARDRASQLP